MTRKKIKSPKPDINFTLDGVDGPVEYSLTPMTQRVAAHVFHNALSGVLSALSGAMASGDDSTKMAGVVARLKGAADFDDVWFILKHMMQNAMVDDVEIGDLDSSDVFDDNPHHMYLVLYHGVKGNWPKLFLSVEAKFQGFASKAKKMGAEMINEGPGDTDQ